MHIYMVNRNAWTFVYTEVVICACAATKKDQNTTQILVFLDFWIF